MSKGFAHLVGSVNLPDAASTFTMVSERLGGRLQRIPDGEVGDRYYWIQFQKDYFDLTPGLSRVGDAPFYIRDRFDGRQIAMDGTVPADELRLPGLGYADAALDSYGVFADLKTRGVVPAGARFQVSLPTPAGVVGSFFREEDREIMEPVYERALFAELARILDGIPHDQFAIQWDTALEFGMLERAQIRGYEITSWFGDTHEEILVGVLERALRQAAAIPVDVEVGYHLCYGDVEEHHFVQPKDAGMLAEVLTGLLAHIAASRHLGPPSGSHRARRRPTSRRLPRWTGPRAPRCTSGCCTTRTASTVPCVEPPRHPGSCPTTASRRSAVSAAVRVSAPPDSSTCTSGSPPRSSSARCPGCPSRGAAWGVGPLVSAGLG
ncbi:MAG: hypothetical protein WDM88_10500 [Galbitalea sp.]